MIRLRRLITRTLREQGGFSLPELLVSMVLFSILAVLIVTAFMSFTRSFNDDRLATRNTNIASVGMNEMTRVLRAATSVPVVNADDLPAFAYANNEKVIFYAYIDTNSAAPAPVKVQFEVLPSSNTLCPRCLVETRWAAHPKPGYPSYWEFDSSSASVRTIARKIVAPVSGENYMFSYKQIGTDLLPVTMTIPNGGILTANLSKIAVVEVTMKVQSDPSQLPDAVIVENQVGLPNLGVSRLGLS